MLIPNKSPKKSGQAGQVVVTKISTSTHYRISTLNKFLSVFDLDVVYEVADILLFVFISYKQYPV